jgi:hypothetical protein
VESLARIILMVLAAALLIQLGRGGWPAVRQWIRAKFVGAAPAGGAA